MPSECLLKAFPGSPDCDAAGREVELEEEVTAWLAQQEIPIYLVGGCVRDRLLNHPSYDLDVAVAGDGLELARRLANHFRGAYYPLDEARSTGRAILGGKGGEQLVVDTARLRSPASSASEPLEQSLRADLADRDFTINALAIDVRAPDSVIDHHGGLSDLAAGLVRAVSDRSIVNDPVRALRAVRLAAVLDFDLAPRTKALIRRDGVFLDQVAGERIRDELTRLLAQPESASHLDRLDELGLLTTVVPELELLRQLSQPPPHSLDGLAHSLQTVRALEEILGHLQAGRGGQFDPLLPFADRLQAHVHQVLSDGRLRLITLKLSALLHDTGKPQMRSVDAEGRIRFIGHEKVAANITGQVLHRLRFSRAEVRLGETIVRHHMRPLLLANQESVSARAVYRFFRATGGAGVDVLLHALADHLATYGTPRPSGVGQEPEDSHWTRLVALTARMLADYWDRTRERVLPPLLIDGHDLMRAFSLQSGPHIGELLEAVREAQASGEVHTREEALDLIRSRLEEGELDWR